MVPEITPACPHCDAALAKPPKRKARCKSCGEAIYVRTTQELFPTAYLTEEQAKAADWLRTLQDQGLGLPTYRQMEASLRREGGDAPPLEVIRAMLKQLIDRGDNRFALWQYARFKADIGEDAWKAQREAFQGEARDYAEAPYVSKVKIHASNCCEACYPFHEKEYTPEQLLADAILPPRGCLRHAQGGDGLCKCRYEPQHDFTQQLEDVRINLTPVRERERAPAPKASGCMVLLMAIGAAVSVVLSACSDSTSPDLSHVGTYDLQTVGGSPLPVVLRNYREHRGHAHLRGHHSRILGQGRDQHDGTPDRG